MTRGAAQDDQGITSVSVPWTTQASDKLAQTETAKGRTLSQVKCNKTETRGGCKQLMWDSTCIWTAINMKSSKNILQENPVLFTIKFIIEMPMKCTLERNPEWRSMTDSQQQQMVAMKNSSPPPPSAQEKVYDHPLLLLCLLLWHKELCSISPLLMHIPFSS